MDSKLFSPKSFGRLQEIELKGIGKDFSFIPDPLPDSLQLNEEISEYLGEANEIIEHTDRIISQLPEYDIFIKHLQNREAFFSSKIEGNQSSIEDLLIHETSPFDIEAPVSEVSNYYRALKNEHLKDSLIDLKLIQELHGTIMEGRYYATPGVLRSVQVYIGRDRRFIPPPPNMLSDLLERFVLNINSEHNIDPLILAFMAHQHFETIHPFKDGNGRIGRLLLSLMIYKNCGLKSSFLHFSSFFDSLKPLYMKGLFKVSTSGDWSNWLKLCLSGVIVQCKDAIYRCEELLKIKEVYGDAITDKELMEVVEKIMFSNPFFSVEKISETLNVSLSTAKSYITQLEEIGVVEFAKYKDTAFYYAPHIFDAAYGEGLEI